MWAFTYRQIQRAKRLEQKVNVMFQWFTSKLSEDEKEHLIEKFHNGPYSYFI